MDKGEIEGVTSHSTKDGAHVVSKLEVMSTELARGLNLTNVKAFFVALIAVTGIYLFHKIPVLIDKF